MSRTPEEWRERRAAGPVQPAELKRGDLVEFVVGMPGPDMDVGIFLRKEGNDYIVWRAPRDEGEFLESRCSRVYRARARWESAAPRTVAEARVIREQEGE